MIYKALRSFSGVISMAAGEERELKDQYLIDNLLKVGYIAPVRDASDQPNAGPDPNARVKSNKSLSRKGGKTKK